MQASQPEFEVAVLMASVLLASLAATGIAP